MSDVPDELPPNLSDAYFAEKRGPLSEAWWIEVYRSSHGWIEVVAPNGKRDGLAASLISVEGHYGSLFGPEAKGTLVIPIDLAEQIAHSILRGVEAFRTGEDMRGGPGASPPPGAPKT